MRLRVWGQLRGSDSPREKGWTSGSPPAPPPGQGPALSPSGPAPAPARPTSSAPVSGRASGGGRTRWRPRYPGVCGRSSVLGSSPGLRSRDRLCPGDRRSGRCLRASWAARSAQCYPRGPPPPQPCPGAEPEEGQVLPAHPAPRGCSVGVHYRL